MTAMNKAVVAVVVVEFDLRESFCLLLESAGYTVEAHESGESLLAVQLSALACIVVDHSPPELNGLNLVEHIRSRGEMAPTVLISDPLSTHDAERIAKLSALTALEMPLVADDLLRHLCFLSVPHRLSN